MASTTTAVPAHVPTESLPSLLLKKASASPPSSPNAIAELADTSTPAHAYLLSLTAQSLSDLRAQPAALKQASASLDSQLSTLCARHVSSFVQVHQATSTLPDALDRLDAELQDLLENKLSNLTQRIQDFPGLVESPLAAKERARNLLEQYDLSLKDLLDIPRLVMTCVRASHPMEALQLGSHIARLAAASAKSSNIDDEDAGPSDRSRRAVLLSLKDESYVHLRRLRDELLRGLGGRGVRLPAARRYYSLLRRFRDVDEAGRDSESGKEESGNNDDCLALSPSAICLSFLRSRWSFIEDMGTQADGIASDPASSLSTHLSAWRDAVGDTCGIAIALFGDADKGADARNSALSDDEPTPLTLLSSFALQSLDKLESLIVPLVSRIAPGTSTAHTIEEAYASLSSLHMQCAYASASLARHGLDFSFSPGIFSAFEQQARRLREQKAEEVSRTAEAKGAHDRAQDTPISAIDRQTAQVRPSDSVATNETTS